MRDLGPHLVAATAAVAATTRGSGSARLRQLVSESVAVATSWDDGSCYCNKQLLPLPLPSLLLLLLFLTASRWHFFGLLAFIVRRAIVVAAAVAVVMMMTSFCPPPPRPRNLICETICVLQSLSATLLPLLLLLLLPLSVFWLGFLACWRHCYLHTKNKNYAP